MGESVLCCTLLWTMWEFFCCHQWAHIDGVMTCHTMLTTRGCWGQFFNFYRVFSFYWGFMFGCVFFSWVLFSGWCHVLGAILSALQLGKYLFPYLVLHLSLLQVLLMIPIRAFKVFFVVALFGWWLHAYPRFYSIFL